MTLGGASRRSTESSQRARSTVPTLWVHSLWDQEDIYGAPAAYAATEAKDTRNDSNFLVIGPWNHGGSMRDGVGARRHQVAIPTRRSISADASCFPSSMRI